MATSGRRRSGVPPLLAIGIFIHAHLVIVFVRSHGNPRVIIAAGALFIGWYAIAQASTGFCSILTWGFNSWGEAFLIMNLFHALQYFGLMWATEKRSLTRMLRVEGRRFAKPAALAALVGASFGYGVWVESLDTTRDSLWAITIVVARRRPSRARRAWSPRRRSPPRRGFPRADPRRSR